MLGQQVIAAPMASLSELNPVFFAVGHELSPVLGFSSTLAHASRAFNESIVVNLPARSRKTASSLPCFIDLKPKADQ